MLVLGGIGGGTIGLFSTCVFTGEMTLGEVEWLEGGAGGGTNIIGDMDRKAGGFSGGEGVGVFTIRDRPPTFLLQKEDSPLPDSTELTESLSLAGNCPTENCREPVEETPDDDWIESELWQLVRVFS